MISFLLASILAFTNQYGSVRIDTLGARVLSYVPTGGQEAFAMLPSGCGGVPICWPWFQYNGPKGRESPKHGLARYREFAVVGRDLGRQTGVVVMQLRSDSETRRLWPHDFVLTVKVSLDEKGLALDMTAQNTGNSAFAVTEAFHPYLLRYGADRFAEIGSGCFRTWDPGPDSHMKTEGLGPDDWKLFVCVENGVFDRDRPVTLVPGETHVLTRVFSSASVVRADLAKNKGDIQ